MTGRGMTGERAVDVARVPTASGDGQGPGVGFAHAVLFYGGGDGLGEVAEILRAAAGKDDPVHMAVPAATMRILSEHWRPAAGSRLIDMTELGRNPARIISAAQSFAEQHAREHVFCVWEPAWPSRSPDELREVARHEALCNLAFSGRPTTIFCLYDTARLSEAVIAGAELTHPVRISAGEPRANRSYLGAGRFPPGCDEPLPPPAEEAASVVIDDQLGPVRQFSANEGRAAGLDRARVNDLVLAVSEIAANALSHAGGGGVVRSWCTSDEVVCQVEDHGYITDPLAGRYRKPADAQGGHGLWLVNRVCDLVERRSSPAGTITRLHMRRPASS
ncbi:MAG TPA: sensor histidine kinase [Streptosporangiaceae bacterium]